MEEIQINFTAVIVAVVVSFIFGFLWYTPLFGKAWAREQGFDPEEKPPKNLMIGGMVFMVIGAFLLVWVFAHNMAAWSFVPGNDAMSPAGNAIMASIFTWLGFFLPVDIGAVFWERKSWKLFGINTSYHFLNLLIIAMIIAHM